VAQPFVLESTPVSHTPEDSGKFQTQIGQDVINEALKSVAKAKAEAQGVELPIDDQALGAGAEAPTDAGQLPSATLTELETLKAELEASQAFGRDVMTKLKDEHEKMLRTAADLENFKKRAAKEKDDVQKYGIEKLLKDFLPIFDNYDRALEHAKSPADFDSLKKGVEMMRKLFEDTLAKHNVKSFIAKGKPFDPTLHEAMTAAETDELPPNHVHTEVLRGFTLSERLVRPALVIVSKAVSAPAGADAPAATTENEV
jgi:molecular chaperone GrpE